MKVLDLHSQVRSQIMKLSVVMPIYNERNTLRSVIERVLSVPLEIEMLCVDDGSGDGSREILADLQTEHPNLRTFLQPCNIDRKSTRLNSSHGYISYAVFCLKKKTTRTNHCTCKSREPRHRTG